MFGVGLYSLNADYLAYTSSLPELELLEAPEDTIPPRYPVAKTTPEEYQDIVKQSPADLRDPENVKTTPYRYERNTFIHDVLGVSGNGSRISHSTGGATNDSD